MAENLQDVSNRLRNRKKEDMAKFIDDIDHTINEEETKIAIPEVVFKEYFLDFFKEGAVDPTSPLLLKWLELAQGPYHEVNVIDDNGEIAFTVPSIYIKPNLDNNINKLDFNNMMGTYDNKLARFENEGMAYLDKNLNFVKKQMSFNKQQQQQTWKNIFGRYEKNAVINTHKNVKVSSTKLNDDVEYDYD